MIKHALSRPTALDQILALDPLRDHVRIVYLMSAYEFPFDLGLGSALALFRSFAAPRAAALIERTDEFKRRPQKRFDDTALLMNEIVEHGYDSDRGRAALRRINRLHHRFDIANEDYLYTISAMVSEPLHWLDRFGWRPLTQHERIATFLFWREIGRRMNIEALPDTPEELERFRRTYEEEHFYFTQATGRLGRLACDAVLDVLPAPLRGLGALVFYALMDDRLLATFGFPQSSSHLRRVVEGALRARSRIVRLLPPRRRPWLLTQKPNKTYPHGYRIEDLGPDITTVPVTPVPRAG